MTAESRRSCLQAGRVIAGKYRLLRCVGSGGMGSVWAAQHLSLRCEVALKLVDPRHVDRAEVLERFEREARSAAALRSPHVVRVFDYGLEDDVPFMVMELLYGETLAARLGRVGRLSLEQTVRLMGQVGRAMQRAHDLGVVHRDLKPDNVFLLDDESDESAKVLDFGVAKLLVDSPLSARMPTRSLPRLAELICHHSPEPASRLAALPVAFDAWFSTGTAKDRARRFRSVGEMMQALASLVSGEQSGSGAATTRRLWQTPESRSSFSDRDTVVLARNGSWLGVESTIREVARSDASCRLAPPPVQELRQASNSRGTPPSGAVSPPATALRARRCRDLLGVVVVSLVTVGLAAAIFALRQLSH